MNAEADLAEPDDVSGLPLIMSREYAKDHGLFGTEVSDEFITPWMQESRQRRMKHAAHYQSI